MGDTTRNIEADDIASRIDTEDPGGCGAREIDGGEGAALEKKAMV